MNKTKKKSKFLLNKSLSMNEELTGLNSSFSHPINEEQEYDSDEGQKKQVKKQVGVFEQFKIKYDELRKDNQDKRKQIDELKKLNKRFQIQLLNINTEFYDKEIKRLRGQLQKHQLESEDYKFKYFQVQNKRKQLESSFKLIQNQLKKIIKQLEGQKVLNAEIKHQLKLKQRQYIDIIQKMQQSGNKTAFRYTEAQTKLNKTQNQLKQLKRQVQIEKKNVQKSQKLKKQLQQENKKIIQKYQVQIKNVKVSLDQTQIQSKHYRFQIASLHQKISELEQQLLKKQSLFNFQASKSFQKINHFRCSRILQIENKRLTEQNKNIILEIQTLKCHQKTMEQLFKQKITQKQEQIKQKQQKLIDLQKKRVAIQKQYEVINLGLKKQIQILKIKNIKAQSYHQNKEVLLKSNSSNNLELRNNLSFRNNLSKVGNSTISVTDNFQQILRSRQTQIKQLKILLGQKVEQIFTLKQQLQDKTLLEQNLSNQIQILLKKLQVQQKNLTNKFNVEKTQIKAEVQSVKRKLQLSDNKLKIKVKQVQQKDSFIANSIIGRIQRQQDVPLIMAQINRVFEAAYIQKLADAQAKIKMLEKNVKSP